MSCQFQPEGTLRTSQILMGECCPVGQSLSGQSLQNKPSVSGDLERIGSADSSLPLLFQEKEGAFGYATTSGPPCQDKPQSLLHLCGPTTRATSHKVSKAMNDLVINT
jgi:hypothetical protein